MQKLHTKCTYQNHDQKWSNKHEIHRVNEIHVIGERNKVHSIHTHSNGSPHHKSLLKTSCEDTQIHTTRQGPTNLYTTKYITQL